MKQPKLKREDWIALRLLYTILASDVSAGQLPDVAKTKHYHEKRFGLIVMLEAFAKINKEAAYNGTFGNPEVRLTRNVGVDWHRSSQLSDVTHPSKALLDMGH